MGEVDKCLYESHTFKCRLQKLNTTQSIDVRQYVAYALSLDVDWFGSLNLLD